MKRNKCPSTGKTRYKTNSIARQAIITIKSHNSYNNKFFRNNKRSTGKSNQKRVYFCTYCKGYHLTSIELYSWKSKGPNDAAIQRYKYLNSIDVEAWKADSIPFEQGHIPPPKIK
jgi:hypothetical protein